MRMHARTQKEARMNPTTEFNFISFDFRYFKIIGGREECQLKNPLDLYTHYKDLSLIHI